MNQLTVSLQHSIATLAANGWSARKIARQLGVHRETVGRYLRPPEPDSKPAIPPTGSCEEISPKPAIPPIGSGAPPDSKPAIVPIGSRVGRPSQCAPWSEVIERAVAAGLSAQRIYQDLAADHGFTGGYDAVKRFVRRLLKTSQLPVRRMESEPGQELQVDFGQGAWITENGRRRRTHLFRCVLSHSRKAYSEAVWRQTTESCIRCLENRWGHGHRRHRQLEGRSHPGRLVRSQNQSQARRVRPLLRHRDRCRLIGPLTATWAEAMHQVRGPQSLRVMHGLLQLAEKHPAPALEKAAGVAVHHGAWHLRDLKRLLTLPGNVVQMDFLQTHPLIRSLEAYRIDPPQTHPPQN